MQIAHQAKASDAAEAGAEDSQQVLKQMLGNILNSLDSNDCESAKLATYEIIKCLKVNEGHVSRDRGGFQYRPDYVLDFVLFTDCLKPAKHDRDTVDETLRRNLCQDKNTL